MRILRHVARFEEARSFLEPPSDADVDPDSAVQTPDGGQGAGDSGAAAVKEEGSSAAVQEEGGRVKKEVGGGEAERVVIKKPIDLGTILKRAESGWYDLEAIAEVRVFFFFFVADQFSYRNLGSEAESEVPQVLALDFSRGRGSSPTRSSM